MGNLSGKYAIAGVGETGYSRSSGVSTRQMAAVAMSNVLADAGLKPADVDGMLSYHQNDSVSSSAVAHDMGMQLNFYKDTFGGGGSTETLVGIAVGVIEVGMCQTVAIFRSMNGYSGFRHGGSGARAAQPVSGSDLIGRTYGWTSAAQHYCFSFMRHMYEYGTTNEQVAHVKFAESKHAGSNPKAIYKQRVTVEDVLNSRWVCKPVHLLDCCVETDNATVLIVTSTERARDLRQPLVTVQGVAGMAGRPRNDFWGYQYGPLTRLAGYYNKDRVFGMAGARPEDIDVTGTYDAFTFAPVMHLEEYGFCPKGAGGTYVSDGTIELDGKRPNNTSGGQLCEGYTHGMNLVIENVRQLRGRADDYCPGWQEGVHSYDYGEGACRQVREPRLSMNMGGIEAYGSALILARG